jgi:hypothetical protein
MGTWIGIIVLGICTLGSLYMTCLAVQSGDSRGPWLFGAFALFFGIFLFILVIKALSQRSVGLKNIEERMFARPERGTTFVPHWFMMTAITLTILVIILLVLIKPFK